MFGSSTPSLTAVLSSPPPPGRYRTPSELHNDNFSLSTIAEGSHPNVRGFRGTVPPLLLAVLSLSLCPVTSRLSPHIRGPGTAWVTVSPPGPSASPCPHPTVATAPSPLSGPAMPHPAPTTQTRPGPGRGSVSPCCPPAPSPPAPMSPWGTTIQSHPVALALRAGDGGGCAGIFREGTAGAMRLRQTMLLGCGIALGQDRRMMAGSGGQCWRMKCSGMLLAWSGCDHPRPPGAALPTSYLSNQNREK